MRKTLKTAADTDAVVASMTTEEKLRLVGKDQTAAGRVARGQRLGAVLDAALIREIPDAVAAKAATQRIYDKLSAFSVG